MLGDWYSCFPLVSEFRVQAQLRTKILKNDFHGRHTSHIHLEDCYNIFFQSEFFIFQRLIDINVIFLYRDRRRKNWWLKTVNVLILKFYFIIEIYAFNKLSSKSNRPSWNCGDIFLSYLLTSTKCSKKFSIFKINSDRYLMFISPEFGSLLQKRYLLANDLSILMIHLSFLNL